MKKNSGLAKKVVMATLMVAAVGGMSLPVPVHAIIRYMVVLQIFRVTK